MSTNAYLFHTVHTETIERMWRPLKESRRRRNGNRVEMNGSYLTEYGARWVKDSQLDAFDAIVHDIADYWKPGKNKPERFPDEDPNIADALNDDNNSLLVDDLVGLDEEGLLLFSLINSYNLPHLERTAVDRLALLLLNATQRYSDGNTVRGCMASEAGGELQLSRLFRNGETNPFTGRAGRPGQYKPYKLALDTTVCLSRDYQLDHGYKVDFAGFFSCQSSQAERKCDVGYSQHWVTSAEGCDVYYYVRPTVFTELIPRPIRVPPYTHCGQ